MSIMFFSGVAPAGARVPLRGPMTRGDYGELSMIQFYEIDQFHYRNYFTKSKRRSTFAPRNRFELNNFYYDQF